MLCTKSLAQAIFWSETSRLLAEQNVPGKDWFSWKGNAAQMKTVFFYPSFSNLPVTQSSYLFPTSLERFHIIMLKYIAFSSFLPDKDWWQICWNKAFAIILIMFNQNRIITTIVTDKCSLFNWARLQVC